MRQRPLEEAAYKEASDQKPNLLSQLGERFGPGQVCKPVVDGALRSWRDQPEVVLLVNLWLPLPRVWKGVASQLFCDDAAEI